MDKTTCGKDLMGCGQMHRPRWYYPEDREPTDEEYAKSLRHDEEFLRVGPRFTAHWCVHQSKKSNGYIDLSSVRSKLLQIFCQRNISDAAVRHFNEIVTEAYMKLR